MLIPVFADKLSYAIPWPDKQLFCCVENAFFKMQKMLDFVRNIMLVYSFQRCRLSTIRAIFIRNLIVAVLTIRHFFCLYFFVGAGRYNSRQHYTLLLSGNNICKLIFLKHFILIGICQ